ncbi:MAG TPA: hypothetical protein VH722_10590 [Alphaproteobacteria bacterium]|jgi:hypothetical protein|nr:hypothetical protein [Alphaproteobacteria bacterium]
MKLRWTLTLAVLALSGCNGLGIGTRVTDLGNGRYKIVTSNADDVAKENAAAARDQCPHGYTLVDKGPTAESLYGSVIRGSDLGTYWTVKCVEPKGDAK